MLGNQKRLRYESSRELLTVFVAGEIDHHSAVAVRGEIDAQMLAQRPQNVALELSAVDFMDSSGLGLIMGRFALAKQYGMGFSVLNPSEAVLKMMRLSGMERMICIAFSEEQKNGSEKRA